MIILTNAYKGFHKKLTSIHDKISQQWKEIFSPKKTDLEKTTANMVLMVKD